MKFCSKKLPPIFTMHRKKNELFFNFLKESLEVLQKEKLISSIGNINQLEKDIIKIDAKIMELIIIRFPNEWDIVMATLRKDKTINDKLLIMKKKRNFNP
jgi:hypothetical protein